MIVSRNISVCKDSSPTGLNGMKYLFTTVWLVAGLAVSAQKTLSFPSSDGLEVTADLYMTNSDTSSFIILFHQAGWSRGEYLEIAPELNALGYNCLAVDQRSGGGINKIKNETTKRAKEAHKPTTYTDALQDIEAAVNYVRKTYLSAKVIIWGSSYSAALVLKYAGENPNNIEAVLSFSPAEYFKPKDFIQRSATNIKCPSFITSAQGEKEGWWNIYQSIATKTKTFYLPTTSGNHGSRALWKTFSDSDGYWMAVKGFLDGIKNPRKQ